MEYESKRRLIVFGPPATGKTTTLATVKGRLHVIDFDRQLKSLITEWKRLKKPMKDLSWTTVDTKQKPAQAFADAKSALFHPPDGFDYYALDSYTTFGIIATHHCCGVGDRNYNQSSNTNLMSYVTDYFWEYANTVERKGAWLIVNMHEKWIEVKDGLVDPNDWRNKKEQINPEVASGARVTIPAQCDFVFHVEKAKKIVRGRAESVSRFRTRGTPFIMAKAVGYEDVLEEVEDADIGKIIDKIKLPPKGRRTSKPSSTTTKPKERKSKWSK